MPYVMVPVPEEHVEEVMQFILRAIAQASIDPWDAASISALFHEVDEPSRSLLAYVARSSIAGDDLEDAAVASMIQLSKREVTGIMRELNDDARDASRPTLIGSRSVSETLPNGRTTEKRVLSMSDEIAVLVQAAERAELADAPQPFAGDA